MLDFADEIERLDDSLVAWANSHRPSPVWLARADFSDASSRLVGCFVTPAEQVLGLRSWDDADEGVTPSTYSLFEVEKLVRMALHQSGLAFEALCSPHCWGDFPARQIARSAVTRGVLAYYRDVTTPLVEGAQHHWRWRTLLTGALLARDGVVSHEIRHLAEALGTAEQFAAGDVYRLRALLEASEHLPERPADYDWLNDFVVASRRGES